MTIRKAPVCNSIPIPFPFPTRHFGVGIGSGIGIGPSLEVNSGREVQR